MKLKKASINSLYKKLNRIKHDFPETWERRTGYIRNQIKMRTKRDE